jgi:L-asparaginase/Glu-tRNA(Gln) amidotransferase subunit D
VVIVHGTNTIEEIAYFLNLTVKHDKPVVTVGAQRPFSTLSSDGPLNLHNAMPISGSSANSIATVRLATPLFGRA